MGARIVDQETIQRMIDAAIAANPGGSSYLVYTALMSQTGAGAPVATVLQNTLGGTVVWTRQDVGDYRGTLAGVFTENKTFVLCSSNGVVGQIICLAGFGAGNPDNVTVFNYSDAAYTVTDNMEAYLEIRVYP